MEPVSTYTPTHFGCDDTAFIQQFLQQHYFGLLLTANLQFSALPFLFNWDLPTALTGTVSCHLARQNPQLAVLEQAMLQGDSVKLVVQGPHAYLAGGCYQQQPQVPTWNYSLVEITGTVCLLDQPSTLALVRRHQAAADRALPQAVQAVFAANALRQKTELMLEQVSVRASQLAYEKQLAAAIVGISIKIEKVHAKMKLSQNKSPSQRQDVLRFLQQTEQQTGQQATVWQLMQSLGD
ncbi:MAG: FMN-binding negative transcriptional regulator [Gammaproteobacteria bacterium]|nr:FMN-binding negative transcriptional regulator [Gammaproteobacteria bacterium]